MTNPNVAEPLRLQSSRPSSCFQSNNPSSTFLKVSENNGLPQPCWRGSATLQSCAILSLAKEIFFHLTKLTRWLANKTLPPNMRLGLGTKGNKDQGLREAQTQGPRTKIQEAEVRTKRSSKRPGLAVDQLCGGSQTIFCLRLYLSCHIVVMIRSPTECPKKRTFRIMLEPQCTGSITICRHPLCLEIDFLVVSYYH